MLILRDAFSGMTRFDEFKASLGIAPNMLSRRLGALVAAGLMQRRRYSQHPVRYEYQLTERGRDFRPVLLALQNWGNRHFAPEGASVLLVDSETGLPADPVLVDRMTGKMITDATHRNAAGPAAGARVHRRLARAANPPSATPIAGEDRPRRPRSTRKKESSR